MGVVVGDANTSAIEKRILDKSASYDLIIDDGSHTSGDIIKSFARYFCHLNNDGLYVIEDLHCSYWKFFHGGLFHPQSSIAFLKRLADVINHEHWGVAVSRKQLLGGFIEYYSLEIDEEELAKIHSIEFINSLCVIRKNTHLANQLGQRIVTGETESVVTVHHLIDKDSIPQPQHDNMWADIDLVSEDELSMLQIISRRDMQLDKLIQSFQIHLDRTKDLEGVISSQVSELVHRSIRIEQADCAQKSQAQRMERLETIVQEQADELNKRQRTIKDLEEQAKRVDEILKQKNLELENQKYVVEHTNKKHNTQNEKIEKLNHQVNQLTSRLKTIQDKIYQMGLGKRRIKTSFFDSSYYLKANPDLVLANVDPLVHYLFHGIFEGRPAVPPKSLLALIPQGIAERGGLAKTIIKAVKKAHREGLPGIRSALNKVMSLAPSHNPGGYTEWVERFDTINDENREAIRVAIKDFRYKPLLSIVMPVYNPPPRFLEKAIESVRSQLYTNWELCIADDASTDPNVLKVLSRLAAQDERIKLVYRQQNGHISASSNSALELANGEFVVLLDHDDELSEHALYHVAKLLNQFPDADLIYSDEDKINEEGKRYDPYFKPDFDPLLFLAQNMISHLGVYRASLVREIGGFRLGYEGSQDWDLALRIVETTDRARIHHIPHVLYHWRSAPGSTAHEVFEKGYTIEAGIKAVSEHLKRVGASATVVRAPEAKHHNRVIFNRNMPNPSVDIIIPTRDRVDILRLCIESIISKSTCKNYRITVVNNGSSQPETFKYFDEIIRKDIKIIHDEGPFNFARLNNLAVSSTDGELICLLNNDVEIISPDWLEEMGSFAMQPDIGCVGARLYYPDGRLQHAGVILGIGGVAGHSHKYLAKGNTGYFCRAVLHQSLSAVTAACLMLRRTVYKEVEGFDERLAIAFNDVDLCLKILDAGYRNVWTPYAEMVHHESASRGMEDTPEKTQRFKNESEFMRRRWGDRLDNDSAYNPNLSLEKEDFSISWPPRI